MLFLNPHIVASDTKYSRYPNPGWLHDGLINYKTPSFLFLTIAKLNAILREVIGVDQWECDYAGGFCFELFTN